VRKALAIASQLAIFKVLEVKDSPEFVLNSFAQVIDACVEK